MELKAFLYKGVFIPSKNQKKLMREAKEAARNYLERKSITIRVKKSVISEVKSRAKRQGIPYQTLVNILLGKYANGEIKLAL